LEGGFVIIGMQMIKTRLLTGFLVLTTSLLLATPALAATLALSPSSGSVGRGCAFSVDVLLDTQGANTDSTDVILLYEPQQITANSVVNGKIFSDFPGNSIDNQTGKVSIYGLSAQNTSFNGIGKVATVNFTASSSATLAAHPINFDFDPANPLKTTDSNVIQKGTTTDTLKSVTNSSFITSSSGCNQTPLVVGQGLISASNSATTVTQLPGTGTFSTTILVIGLGILLSLLGILGLSGS
jgi:hypothetical protein